MAKQWQTNNSVQYNNANNSNSIAKEYEVNEL